MNDDRPAVARLNDARHYAREVRQIASDVQGGLLGARDYLAIYYCLVVIGEADRVPDDVLAREAAIPWRSVVGLRHRLVHGYWLIDQEIVSEAGPQTLETCPRHWDADPIRNAWDIIRLAHVFALLSISTSNRRAMRRSRSGRRCG